MAPRIKAAVIRDDCKEFLWPLCPRHKQNLPRRLKICTSKKISVKSKLNPVCTGYCALCLSCLLKICCPFSGQLTICGAQHLLALTEYKCLANIPVWLWRKQKLFFHSTPSSEGVKSTRGNSACKHRRSSSSQQSKGYHPSPNILLRNPSAHSNNSVLTFPRNIYRHPC